MLEVQAKIVDSLMNIFWSSKNQESKNQETKIAQYYSRIKMLDIRVTNKFKRPKSNEMYA